MSAAPAKVSVIVPVLDVGPLLDEAMASLRAQTFTDFEVLLVDDGSSDSETLAALARAEAGGARLFRLPHGGVTRARNHGIAQARGEYLCFFDADDRMLPQLLERTVSLLASRRELAFASFWVRLFGAEEWDWQPPACDLRALLCDCTVATAALVRRSAVQAVGGFDEAMERGHEDWDLWLTLVESGHPGEIIPEVLFEYRRRPGSRSEVADRDPTYLALMGERFDKHAASYHQHLPALLGWRDQNIGERLMRIAAGSGLAEERAALERRSDELWSRALGAGGR